MTEQTIDLLEDVRMSAGRVVISHVVFDERIHGKVTATFETDDLDRIQVWLVQARARIIWRVPVDKGWRVAFKAQAEGVK